MLQPFLQVSHLFLSLSHSPLLFRLYLKLHTYIKGFVSLFHQRTAAVHNCCLCYYDHLSLMFIWSEWKLRSFFFLLTVTIFPQVFNWHQRNHDSPHLSSRPPRANDTHPGDGSPYAGFWSSYPRLSVLPFTQWFYFLLNNITFQPDF